MFNVCLPFLFHLLLEIGEFSQENPEDFSRYNFCRKNTWFENAVP